MTKRISAVCVDERFILKFNLEEDAAVVKENEASFQAELQEILKQEIKKALSRRPA